MKPSKRIKQIASPKNDNILANDPLMRVVFAIIEYLDEMYESPKKLAKEITIEKLKELSEITPHLYNVLKYEKLLTLKRVSDKREHWFRGIRGVGKKTMLEIKQLLAKYNLEFEG